MPNTWDDIRALGSWDYIAQRFATWDDLYNDVRQPEPPPAPIPGPQLGVCPDLAGLSLGGAYQAGLAAGFTKFQVVAYRATPMSDNGYWFRLVAPAVGYVAQTTTPGSHGHKLDTTPPDGSFFTGLPDLGVPDQLPDPGEVVSVNDTLCFVYQVSDAHVEPNDFTNFATDRGVMTWWEYTFEQNNVPATLLADIASFNGPPRPPVDVAEHEWPVIPQDPLAIFTSPPPPEPEDLLADIPQFERRSYEIRAVLRAVASELARIAAAQAALIQNWFPASADVLLGRFEAMLGLPVEPAGVDLGLRRTLVLAYMRRLRSEGRGLDWEAALRSLAGTAWNYREHDPGSSDPPYAHTIDVNIPQTLAYVGWKLVRDITPAHIAINEGYTGGWLIGVSLLDIDLL